MAAGCPSSCWRSLDCWRLAADCSQRRVKGDNRQEAKARRWPEDIGHLPGNLTDGHHQTLGGNTAYRVRSATRRLRPMPSITQDAFSQSIVMGANIQFNSLPLNVAGNDIVTAHDSQV
jgi:hypothetical protein